MQIFPFWCGLQRFKQGCIKLIKCYNVTKDFFLNYMLFLLYFDQINKDLVSISDFFQKHFPKHLTDPRLHH